MDGHTHTDTHKHTDTHTRTHGHTDTHRDQVDREPPTQIMVGDFVLAELAYALNVEVGSEEIEDQVLRCMQT